jgi:hypothetical protein
LQSTLVPEGDTARAIAGLFWFFTAVWLMVMTLLLIAVVRKLNYEAHQADQTFETANEIHIPVGQPVKLEFESPDAIHSFWVPNLAGKQDLIPGRYTQLTIKADKAGVYHGQCAEYCGI